MATEKEYSDICNLTSIRNALSILRDIHLFQFEEKDQEKIQEYIGGLADIRQKLEKKIKLKASR